MNGLLTGAHPDSLLNAQAEMLAERPLAGGQDWAARNVMYYDRIARMGFADFTFEECDELHRLRTLELHGRAVCMLPEAEKRYSFMVFCSKMFPVH
jgi:hypothetical protein